MLHYFEKIIHVSFRLVVLYYSIFFSLELFDVCNVCVKSFGSLGLNFSFQRLQSFIFRALPPPLITRIGST